MTRWKNFNHRGDYTETLIDEINQLYERQEMAMVTKVPVPIKVIEIGDGMISKAFFEKKSTVDYIGMCQGFGLCFDVKETNQKYLPLKNIHEHQIVYMNTFQKQGGWAFIICHLKVSGDFYLIPMELLNYYWYESTRQSIPLDAMVEKGYPIPMEQGLPNYLSAFNSYISAKK